MTALACDPLQTPFALREAISDLTCPDFGEPLLPLPGETLMYWGCGLTAIEALRLAGVPRYAPIGLAACW